MPLILPVNGVHPVFGNDCFIAPNATVVGQVSTGDQCSIWFNAVVRGDVNTITIGNKVNIQDNAVLHGTFERAATAIGDNVSIGHSAIVHGCTLHNNILVGMGAIIMDHTVVHDNVLVAAGSVVLENSVLESGWIYGGVPAKKLKPLSPEEFAYNIARIANNYITYAGWFKTSS